MGLGARALGWRRAELTNGLDRPIPSPVLGPWAEVSGGDMLTFGQDTAEAPGRP